ncbi:peroxide stress protein YaaA [Helicobacter muridarum]|uniref:Peroxide stress protein YaaA n=1 Tax=Helicobacter muridarum TaxID=216 RepID=A0A099TXP6_9HELI|nr:peroxide stress protein YaaA [Helicobacter muridarum]TLD98215.1 peroxide stress protein YaaA [Helicobacter muridarum]STQ87151.1 Protein of uncharacterised function (DUF328) [Helicobacter muridarum]
MSYNILLSPSEEKILESKEYNLTNIQNYNSSSFLSHLWKNDEIEPHRRNIYEIYIKYIQQIKNSMDCKILIDLYGAKQSNSKIEYEISTILSRHNKHTQYLMPAIYRYAGVAFQGLDYSNLPQNAKNIILNNVLIFSNLFGAIRASDMIPFYKLKQGSKLYKLSLKEVYNPFISILESIQNEVIIDLRANIYAKIWSPKDCLHLFFEFYKNGKTISHYAKLYRGKILRLISLHLSKLDNVSKSDIMEFLLNLNSAEICFMACKEKANMQILQYEIKC